MKHFIIEFHMHGLTHIAIIRADLESDAIRFLLERLQAEHEDLPALQMNVTDAGDTRMFLVTNSQKPEVYH